MINKSNYIGKVYTMDTGAISFSVANKVNNQFRVVAHLSRDINAKLLQKAVDLTMPRFPSFCVKYSKGKGCVLNITTVQQTVTVQPYQLNFTKIDMFDDQPKLKVYYQKSAIAVELYHTISDASGALQLLNSILATYLGIVGEYIDYEGVIAYNSPIKEDEFVDGYTEFAKKGKTIISPVNLSRPMQLKGTKLITSQTDSFYRVVLSSADLKRMRDTHGATAHEVLVTTMYLAYLEIARHSGSNKQIRIQMAVGMRSLFNSNTLRNFAGSVQFSTASKDFNGILAAIKEFMAIATSEKECRSFLHTGVSLIKNVLPKLPAPVGKMAVNIGNNIVGEKGYSTNLSNLGVVRHNLPCINSYDFVLSPPLAAPFCVAACGYGDNCSLIFSRHIDNDAFEKEFISQLALIGITPLSTEYLK